MCFGGFRRSWSLGAADFSWRGSTGLNKSIYYELIITHYYRKEGNMNLSTKNRAFVFIAVILLAGAVISGCGSDASRPESESDANVVYTSNGPVRGRIENNGVHVFKGVRYGAPPVGKLRFKPLVRPASWAEQSDHYNYGNMAMQDAGLPGAAMDLREVSEA